MFEDHFLVVLLNPLSFHVSWQVLHTKLLVLQIYGFYDDDSLLEQKCSNHSFIGVGSESNMTGDDVKEGDVESLNEEDVVLEDPCSDLESGLVRGMQVNSIYAFFEYYQEHAKLKSFNVVRRSVCRNTYALLTCDKSGKAGDNSSSKRSGCHLRVNAVVDDDGVTTRRN